MTFSTRPAVPDDLVAVEVLDGHLARPVLAEIVGTGRLLVVEDDGEVVGVLRWGLLWDEVPFMNLLRLRADSRGRGLGRVLVEAWERDQRAAGHGLVLTSTVSTERAQHFFRHLGYVDSGALLLPGEPDELLLRKRLDT